MESREGCDCLRTFEKWMSREGGWIISSIQLVYYVILRFFPEISFNLTKTRLENLLLQIDIADEIAPFGRIISKYYTMKRNIAMLSPNGSRLSDWWSAVFARVSLRNRNFDKTETRRIFSPTKPLQLEEISKFCLTVFSYLCPLYREPLKSLLEIIES